MGNVSYKHVENVEFTFKKTFLAGPSFRCCTGGIDMEYRSTLESSLLLSLLKGWFGLYGAPGQYDRITI